MADFDRIKETVFKGKVGGIADLVRGALDEGISPQEIIDQGLIFGMNEVGVRFKNDDDGDDRYDRGIEAILVEGSGEADGRGCTGLPGIYGLHRYGWIRPGCGERSGKIEGVARLRLRYPPCSGTLIMRVQRL